MNRYRKLKYSVMDGIIYIGLYIYKKIIKQIHNPKGRKM